MNKKLLKSTGIPSFLAVFHIVFIILMAIFAEYKFSIENEEVSNLYASNLYYYCLKIKKNIIYKY